ncbi:MAG: hypothetical protein HY578_00200 [Nitrospinae bacterium]|nr:hypothetical protein [Nitrospinota bacterium]
MNRNIPLSAKNDRVSILFEYTFRLVLSLLLTTIFIANLSATIQGYSWLPTFYKENRVGEGKWVLSNHI